MRVFVGIRLEDALCLMDPNKVFVVFLKLVTFSDGPTICQRGPNGIQMIIERPFNRPKTMALVSLKSVILLKEAVSCLSPKI